jgi:hypothetical protein
MAVVGGGGVEGGVFQGGEGMGQAGEKQEQEGEKARHGGVPRKMA